MSATIIRCGTLSEEAAETIAQALLDDGETEAGNALIRQYGERVLMADDGNCEVETTADTLREAAEQYVADGDWGDDGQPGWVTVYVWERWTLGELELDGEERESHDIEVKAKIPACYGEHEHEWCSPLAVVGGIPQNPGVWGNGGGVIKHEICRHCGARKTTDTWAQNPANGKCGLTQVSYARLGDHEMSDEYLEWDRAR